MLFINVLNKVLANLSNIHLDNHDSYRFGKLSARMRIGLSCLRLLQKFNLIFFRQSSAMRAVMADMLAHSGDLEDLYFTLGDTKSKETLENVLTYRLLAFYRYKLPLSNRGYRNGIDAICKMATDSRRVLSAPNDFLIEFDLNCLGYPIKMYGTAQGIYMIFALKQYEYHADGISISACPGDTVIDAGGCHGDTALYFASKVGGTGKVFTFEFVPANIDILNRNLDCNPGLKKTIVLIPRPLWSAAGLDLAFIEDGAGSRLSSLQGQHCNTHTYTIDQMVKDVGIRRIDFIKMDIEGAEFHALQGAADSIQEFKPKLAISVYHNGLADLATLHTLVRKLNPQYELYLGHYTIHCDETVLYAIDRSRA